MSISHLLRRPSLKTRVSVMLVLFSAIFGGIALLNFTLSWSIQWLTPLPFLLGGTWLALTAGSHAHARLLLALLVVVGGTWFGYTVGNTAL